MTAGPETPPATTLTAARRTAAATALGGLAFAAIGLLADDPSGAAARLLVPAAGIVAAAFAAAGFAAFRTRHRSALGRLGGWGTGLVLAGLAATALGFLVNALGPLLPDDAAAAASLIGVPAWSLAHLVYVGATVLGPACLRAPDVPRPLAVALTAALPLMIAGVLLGLALGGTTGTLAAWAATEGQAGLTWILLGLHLRTRRP